MGSPYRMQIKQLTGQLDPYLGDPMRPLEWQSATKDRIGGVILRRETNGLFAFQRRYDLQFLGQVGTERLVEQYLYAGSGTLDEVLRAYVDPDEYTQNKGDGVLIMMALSGASSQVEPHDYQRLAEMLGQTPLAHLQ